MTTEMQMWLFPEGGALTGKEPQGLSIVEMVRSFFQDGGYSDV